MCARQVVSHLPSYSVGLIDLSFKTNTMSILQLAFTDWMAFINMLLVMSLECFIVAAYIIYQAHTICNSCYTRNNLFIFLRVDSA